jgi:hypothetical protein
MNLHDIVAPCVAQVNPWINATLQKSTGYTTAPTGKRIPTYAAPVNIRVQMQALQYNDIQQISGLNIQGVRQAMYLDGDWSGVVRDTNQGGDIITLETGEVWLVAMVLERWTDTAGWVKVCATKQVAP